MAAEEHVYAKIPAGFENDGCRRRVRRRQDHVRRNSRRSRPYRHALFARWSRPFIVAGSEEHTVVDKKLDGMLLRTGDKKAETIEQTARADTDGFVRNLLERNLLANSAAAAVVFSPAGNFAYTFLQQPW